MYMMINCGFLAFEGNFFNETTNGILHQIEDNNFWYLSFEPHLQQKYTFYMWKNVANIAIYLAGPFLSSITHSHWLLVQYSIYDHIFSHISITCLKLLNLITSLNSRWISAEFRRLELSRIHFFLAITMFPFAWTELLATINHK